MEEERRWREVQEKSIVMEQNKNSESNASLSTLDKPDHLFKRLLVACCDSCERRASVHTCLEIDRTMRYGHS